MSTPVAEFIGTMDGFGPIPPIELWRLRQDITGHPEFSVVSRKTIEKAGFTLPVVTAEAIAEAKTQKAA